MALPSVFEVFQLAIGPSTVFTTGALRIGQAFREVLLSSPYRSNYRILIELLGDFSKFGREYNSDQAVIAGLAGFTLEETGMRLKTFYGKIKENGCFSFSGDIWPFNPESDLIFNDNTKKIAHQNCIRFHLLGSQGQPVFQTEYHSIGNGLIKGIHTEDSKTIILENSPECLSEIKEVITTEMISLMEYVISGECSIHRISRDQFQKRMLATWKLMMANADRGLKTMGSLNDRMDSNVTSMYKSYLAHLSANPSAGSENTRASIYALALSEEILNNHPVITAPTCSGSTIVPAVFRLIQEKFMLSEEKMVQGLIVSGLFGSLILHQVNQSPQIFSWHSEVAASAIMAAAGVTYLLGGSLNEIEKSASMATLLYGASCQKTSPFEPKSFLLLNTMVAQTLPALTDLARIQPDGMIPKFDDTLKSLFRLQ
ncbi:MAG: serine dehydratase beta chain [Bacteroidales bacterium]